MKAIIFDFDGVLHNSYDFHRENIKEFTGVDMEDQNFRDMHNGNIFDHNVSRLKDANWLGYRDYIYQQQSEFVIEEDVKNVLLGLNKDYDLFVVSSGGTKNITDCLKNNGIINLFKEILGLEFSKSKVEKFKYIFSHYKFKSDECIFITDTLGDILEANEVDLKTIAVDFGFHDRETLAKGQPFKIISRMVEVLDIVNKK